MTKLDSWLLSHALNVVEAALVFAGLDPSDLAHSVEGMFPEEQPGEYKAMKRVLIEALRARLIEGEIVPEQQQLDFDGNSVELAGTVDLKRSRVFMESATDYLSRRGHPIPMRGAMQQPTPPYLDSENTCFSFKLSAAIRVWQALTQEGALPAKSVKQSMVRWLKLHAQELGLTNPDGSPNATGIEEIAKVANWKPGGGVPKTPS